jgi:Tol biopolymer transport system component
MHSAPHATAVAFALLLACHHGGDPAGQGVAGPRSGGLVFVKEVDGQADLARARITDGAVVVVSATPEREERWPYWSDVAGRVVFQARPYGPALQTDLLLWDPESAEEAILASTPARDERWPTWSPVAPRLAYAFKQPRVPSGIALYDLVTERSEVAASIAVPGFFLRPAFSPEGRRLVAQRRAGRSPETHLWLLESGRPPRRLTGDPGAIDTKARFTPDGRAILFNRQIESGGTRDLFRLDLETGIPKRFASLPTADDHSAWPSPTRDEIAFISDRDGSHDAFLLDLADGAPRNLTRSPEIDEGVPLWSPNGERLVILRRPRTESGRRPSAEESRLAVINREGHVLFETQGMMADWMPAWPEGTAR